MRVIVFFGLILSVCIPGSVLAQFSVQIDSQVCPSSVELIDEDLGTVVVREGNRTLSNPGDSQILIENLFATPDDVGVLRSPIRIEHKHRGHMDELISQENSIARLSSDELALRAVASITSEVKDGPPENPNAKRFEATFKWETMVAAGLDRDPVAMIIRRATDYDPRFPENFGLRVLYVLLLSPSGLRCGHLENIIPGSSGDTLPIFSYGSSENYAFAWIPQSDVSDAMQKINQQTESMRKLASELDELKGEYSQIKEEKSALEKTVSELVSESAVQSDFIDRCLKVANDKDELAKSAGARVRTLEKNLEVLGDSTQKLLKRMRKLALNIYRGSIETSAEGLADVYRRLEKSRKKFGRDISEGNSK